MSEKFNVFAHRDFGLFVAVCFLTNIIAQTQGVAVGWDLYERTGSPLALGFVGLANFLPVLILFIPAGQIADRYDRRKIVEASLAVWALGLDADALRFREDRAVVPLHAVRQASVWRLISLVALRSVGIREVNQVESADGRVGAGTGVKVLPARPRNLARWVRQVQFIQPIGGGDLELRAGVERPVDDVALPKVELDALANMEQRELYRSAVQVHIVREVAHDPIRISERERGVVGLAAPLGWSVVKFPATKIFPSVCATRHSAKLLALGSKPASRLPSAFSRAIRLRVVGLAAPLGWRVVN